VPNRLLRRTARRRASRTSRDPWYATKCSAVKKTVPDSAFLGPECLGTPSEKSRLISHRTGFRLLAGRVVAVDEVCAPVRLPADPDDG
jgi:hypothetical protein